jgi:hypothetical protein
MPAPHPTLSAALALALLGAFAGPPARAGGAADARRHWAFGKLHRPAVPAVRDGRRARTPVDAFVLVRLEAKGLRLAPEADRATLLRRAYLDLLGVPPPPEELRAFLSDPRPDAYERLLDRLLASPHFGERWGRHWLDEAGYVDVIGVDNDAPTIKLGENRWLYRDYVIRSYNADKPLARFLTEQLAGDELVDWRSAKTFTPEVRELLVATCFLRTAADDTDERELKTPDILHGILQRTTETVAGNLLGLTYGCAKCHDHKYEPIRQCDYYRLVAFFQPVYDPGRWLTPSERALADVAPPEKAAIDRHNADLDARAAPLKKELEALKKQKGVSNDRVQALERQINELNGRRRGYGHLQVTYEVGPPAPTHILRRGDYRRPGKKVGPGLPGFLCEPGAADVLPPAKAAGQSSGRRLALARVLADPTTPAGALVLRVRVNRVWQHLFGRGLAETSDNLGLSGAPPTHPELLEWLAAEYAAGGGRLKPLLRLLMTSAVYRQASAAPAKTRAAGVGPDPRKVDPDNRLLWRMPLRRIDAEVVRDSLLAVSGRLDRTLFGPPVAVESRPDGTQAVPETGLPTPTSRYRRSIYLLSRRNYHPTLLGVFDQPLLATNCTRRTPAAVVLQPLTMLNDRLVVEQAEHLAGRVAQAAGTEETGKQIETAFRLVLARDPSAREMTWSRELLARQAERYRRLKTEPEQARRRALAHLCHMLVNTSEFLYTP